MPPNNLRIQQNLIDEDDGPIEMCGPVPESQLTLDYLERFKSTIVGISPAYTASGRLSFLAISDRSHVLIIQFHGNQTKSEVAGKGRGRSPNGRNILQDHLLCQSVGSVYAFDLGLLALSLYFDHGLRIANGVDIQSGCPIRRARDPRASIKFAAGDNVHERNISAIFEEMVLDDKDSRRTFRNIALRAWISHRMSQLPDMEHHFERIPKVDTQKLNEVVCVCTVSLIIVDLGGKSNSTSSPPSLVMHSV
jgi:hypothetical protein